MNITEAIILAGGIGSRLQSVVSDVPKPMALIGDKPFLYFLLNYLKKSGIKRTVLSVGYLHETIIDYFGHEFEGMPLLYAVEEEPLGTGGAIKLSAAKIVGEQFFLLNGDSFFAPNLSSLDQFHTEKKALISLSLKEMIDFDRYGSVILNQNDTITSFMEKKYCTKGYINAGVYAVDKKCVENFPKNKFSFEKDILEPKATKSAVYGMISDGFFIDIGIPEDYSRVQQHIHELE